MSDSLTLSVPKEITYAIRRKVFPRKKERSDNVSVTETTFSVFNYGDDNLTDLSFKHEPLISEHDGSHRSAKLILLPESDADGEQENDSHTILAGGQIRFSLSVTGELGPGIYRSNIRVRKKPDNEAITIPVVVSVREHWVYAFVALLFFNVRFAIALIIGIVIQLIRFYNEKEPFGAKKRDYVEAFALGVGVDAGVRGIVEVIGNIGLPV